MNMKCKKQQYRGTKIPLASILIHLIKCTFMFTLHGWNTISLRVSGVEGRLWQQRQNAKAVTKCFRQAGKTKPVPANMLADQYISQQCPAQPPSPKVKECQLKCLIASLPSKIQWLLKILNAFCKSYIWPFSYKRKEGKHGKSYCLL